jgi:energy-coupling factor transporter ATP-binding protein EcfA2
VAEPTLTDVVASVREYLDLDPDEVDYLVTALAVGVAAELDDEEPLWLILAGPSGSGKTEAIRLLARVADQQVDELTRAGLLSWTPGAKPKRAGLLTQVPPVALVTISDLSTVLTMGDREARARMFGMLRVIYDGRVYRSIGGAGPRPGDPLAWEGHLTLLAGATPAIDTYLAFEASLGERWLLYRLPEPTTERARRRAAFSVERSRIGDHRHEAQDLAAELIRAARRRIPAVLKPRTLGQILSAATFCAHARTGVQYEGVGRGRVVVGVPAPEEPMRLAGQLHRLTRCLIALGVDEAEAERYAVHAARDSVPSARFKAIEAVAENEMATVASVLRSIGRGNRWTAKWELGALVAIGMIEVEGPDEDEDAKATRVYQLAPNYREVYESVSLSLRAAEDRERIYRSVPTTSYTSDSEGAVPYMRFRPTDIPPEIKDILGL